MASLFRSPTQLCHHVAFVSCSIGLPRHTLHQKIEAIREAGFDALNSHFLIFKPSPAAIVTEISPRVITYQYVRLGRL